MAKSGFNGDRFVMYPVRSVHVMFTQLGAAFARNMIFYSILRLVVFWRVIQRNCKKGPITQRKGTGRVISFPQMGLSLTYACNGISATSRFFLPTAFFSIALFCDFVSIFAGILLNWLRVSIDFSFAFFDSFYKYSLG